MLRDIRMLLIWHDFGGQLKNMLRNRLAKARGFPINKTKMAYLNRLKHLLGHFYFALCDIRKSFEKFLCLEINLFLQKEQHIKRPRRKKKYRFILNHPNIHLWENVMHSIHVSN